MSLISFTGEPMPLPREYVTKNRFMDKNAFSKPCSSTCYMLMVRFILTY